jgi:pyroglutamyl-peptidase
MKKTLLITAFEPFGGREQNASALAMNALPACVAGYQLRRITLPVEYGRAADLLQAALEETAPDAVLCLGLAAGRRAVTPEFVAVNARDASIADNAGVLLRGVPCDPDGPAAYGTRLPVREMVAALADRGIPAAVSYTAGAYICNDVFYRLLRILDVQGRSLPAGFIHLPDLSGDEPLPEGTFRFTVDVLRDALETCIACLG